LSFNPRNLPLWTKNTLYLACANTRTSVRARTAARIAVYGLSFEFMVFVLTRILLRKVDYTFRDAL